MKWFRVYHSVVDSVKVRTMSADAQLDYFLLLCCASEYRERTDINDGSTGLTLEQAAWRLRRQGTLEGTFPTLVEHGLATLKNDQTIALLDWSKRQFKSDDVAKRTGKVKAKQRTAKRNVPANGNGNVPGNVRDTDTDTDIKQLQGVSNQVADEPCPACPYDSIVQAYHELLPNCPRTESLTEARKTKIKQRWRECRSPIAGLFGYHTEAEGIAKWREFFAWAAQSDFLTGRTEPINGHRAFVADLEWLVTLTNFTKVVEKKYHRKNGSRSVNEARPWH